MTLWAQIKSVVLGWNFGWVVSVLVWCGVTRRVSSYLIFGEVESVWRKWNTSINQIPKIKSCAHAMCRKMCVEKVSVCAPCCTSFLSTSRWAGRTRYCCGSSCSALFWWFSNWWINFWTACLRMWQCSRKEHSLDSEVYFSATYFLYVPPCLSEWLKNFLASELVVS